MGCQRGGHETQEDVLDFEAGFGEPSDIVRMADRRYTLCVGKYLRELNRITTAMSAWQMPGYLDGRLRRNYS